MRCTNRAILVALLVVAAAAFCGRADEDLPKAIEKDVPVPASVHPALAKLLAPKAAVVVEGDKELAAYWVRSSVPLREVSEQPTYDLIPEGTFLGVVEIKGEDLTDFRDQKLGPGVYTLRMGLQPQDGNHMGVAPTPEFLCLVPASKDASPEPMTHDGLMKISKDAAGTGHPAVLFLAGFLEKPEGPMPNISTNEQSHVILNLKTQAAAGEKSVEFPIGIVIIGITAAP